MFAACSTWNLQRYESGIVSVIPTVTILIPGGSGQTEISPGDWFPSVHPLPEARTAEDLDAYQGWPDMDDSTRVAHVRDNARRLA